MKQISQLIRLFADIRTKVETQQLANDYVYYPFVYFFVDDPAHIDEIMAAEQERDDIPWEYYLIGVDESEYSIVAEPLRSMHTTILVITCIVAAVLLILLYLVLRMSMQGRIREIKLYRALGIGKKQIWAQFVLECVLIAVLAFVPAAAVSAVSTNAVGNALLTVSTESEEQRESPTDAEWEQAALNGTTQQLQEELAAMEMDNTPDEIDAGLPLVPTVGILLAVLVLTGGFACCISCGTLSVRLQCCIIRKCALEHYLKGW